jgi:hypothetical protein
VQHDLHGYLHAALDPVAALVASRAARTRFSVDGSNWFKAEQWEQGRELGAVFADLGVLLVEEHAQDLGRTDGRGQGR